MTSSEDVNNSLPQEMPSMHFGETHEPAIVVLEPDGGGNVPASRP